MQFSDAIESRLASLKKSPKSCGIFVDYDGVLAPIVMDPAQARPLPGAVEVLDELANRYSIVGVLSGRTASFLMDRLPVSPSVKLCGLYGLQRVKHGEVYEIANAKQWRAVVDSGATTAEIELPREVDIERKGISFALHFRSAPEFGPVVEEWAAQYAASTGLDAQRGRLSVELGPFHHVDKGKLINEFCEGLRGACMFGDDGGDISAFYALDHIAKAKDGFIAVKIGVESREMPAMLISATDGLVSGPQAALAALNYLAE